MNVDPYQDSYYRQCPHCGRRIQMRKTPSGQWLAYEGYDLIHDCERQPTPKRLARNEGRRESRSEGRSEKQNDAKWAMYRELAFADIVLPGSVPPSQPVVPAAHSETANGALANDEALTSGTATREIGNDATASGESSVAGAAVLPDDQPTAISTPVPLVQPNETPEGTAEAWAEIEETSPSSANRNEMMGRIGMIFALVMALVVVVLLLFRPTDPPASPSVAATSVVTTSAPTLEATPVAVVEATSIPAATPTGLPTSIPAAIPTAIPTFTSVAVVVPEVVEPTPTLVLVQVDTIPRAIAYVVGDAGAGDIYAIINDPAQPVSVVNSVCDEAEPEWSPGGERIAFHANCNGSYDILDVPFNNGSVDAGEIRFLTATAGYDEFDPNYSPNGKTVVFWRVLRGADRNEDGEIWALDIESGHSYPLGVNGQAPVWSADGLKLAYMSMRSGSWNVYRRDFISGNEELVSFGCPTHCGWPEWSPDSTSIAYNSTVSQSDLRPEGIWVWTPPQRIPRKWISGTVGRPTWSATGLVAFDSGRGLEMSAPDNDERHLILDQATAWAPSWAE